MTKLFLCFVLLSLNPVHGQTIRAEREPKTRNILITDSNRLLQKTDTLAFIAPFVFSGTTGDYSLIKSKTELFFTDSIQPYIDTINKKIEAEYRRCCNFWYMYTFNRSPKFEEASVYSLPILNEADVTIPAGTKSNHTLQLYSAAVTDEDYKTIGRQLKKLEILFNDSVISSNKKINDTLYGVLGKYSSSLCVLTDIKEACYKKIMSKNENTAACLYRIVVIDMKTKTIRYYIAGLMGTKLSTEYGSVAPEGMEKKHPTSYVRLKLIGYMAKGLQQIRKSKQTKDDSK